MPFLGRRDSGLISGGQAAPGEMTSRWPRAGGMCSRSFTPVWPPFVRLIKGHCLWRQEEASGWFNGSLGNSLEA